jgi:hypothetical protein
MFFYIMVWTYFWSNFSEFNYDLAKRSAWCPPWFFSVKTVVTTRSCGAAGSPFINVKMLTDGFLTSVLPSCKYPAPSVVKRDDELTPVRWVQSPSPVCKFLPEISPLFR